MCSERPLDKLFSPRQGGPSTIILSERTATRFSDLGKYKAALFGRVRKKEGLDQTTIDHFEQVNQVPVRMRLDFEYRGRVHLMTEDELKYLRDEASYVGSTFGYGLRAPYRSFWRQFSAAHPFARALVTLSQVGFSRDRTEALVEVSYEESKGTLIGAFVLLRKREGHWSVITTF